MIRKITELKCSNAPAKNRGGWVRKFALPICIWWLPILSVPGMEPPILRGDSAALEPVCRQTDIAAIVSAQDIFVAVRPSGDISAFRIGDGQLISQGSVDFGPRRILQAIMSGGARPVVCLLTELPGSIGLKAAICNVAPGKQPNLWPEGCPEPLQLLGFDSSGSSIIYRTKFRTIVKVVLSTGKMERSVSFKDISIPGGFGWRAIKVGSSCDNYTVLFDRGLVGARALGTQLWKRMLGGAEGPTDSVIVPNQHWVGENVFYVDQREKILHCVEMASGRDVSFTPLQDAGSLRAIAEDGAWAAVFDGQTMSITTISNFPKVRSLGISTDCEALFSDDNKTLFLVPSLHPVGNGNVIGRTSNVIQIVDVLTGEKKRELALPGE